MTYPRSHLVSEEEPGFYHVVSRCVRRAFLCGQDRITGRCFEHRRAWIEGRILELSDAFGVSVYSYSVMSNHFHVVLHVDPTVSATWSDDEVARRWLIAFPGELKRNPSEELAQRLEMAILSDPERVQVLRKRLGSLSWFMKALNEPIARMANQEDDCTGKFWEGRFKCQALLEEQAVLSCMVYVDLNPVRAAMCDTLADSDHTAIQKRLEADSEAPRSLKAGSAASANPLKPVAGLDADSLLDLTEGSYVHLVQWTGEQIWPDKRGKLRPIAAEQRPPAPISRLTRNPKAWLRQVQGTESIYYRAIGSAEALMEKAAALGQAWMKGVAAAREKTILGERPT
jgi:REP element-mobilizing transposase RayT